MTNESHPAYSVLHWLRNRGPAGSPMLSGEDVLVLVEYVDELEKALYEAHQEVISILEKVEPEP